MSVLIRRSDAIAIIQNADYKYPTWPHIVEAKEGMVQAIKSAHTIDAAPVVRGEWIKKSSELTETLALCSKCSYPISWWHKTNFCPNCGAKMESEGST